MHKVAKIEGMHCNSCEQKIGSALRNVEGVSNVRVSQEKSEAQFDVAGFVDDQQLKNAVDKVGDYQIHEISDVVESNHASRNGSVATKHDVTHQEQKHRFVFRGKGGDSFIEYQRDGQQLKLVHTFVPPADRNQEIAESLTRSALGYAKDNGLQVIPLCSYVRNFLEKHPDAQDLVDVKRQAPESDTSESAGNAQSPDSESGSGKSWWATYRPLLIIVAYLMGGTLIGAFVRGSWEAMPMMSTFMGLFFLVFSFFKMLDLRGFASAYSSYDIIAARWYAWGFIYPFIELTLGSMYLMAFQPIVTNLLTLIVMTISTIGVINAVVRGRDIQCGCLGTMFNLPMSTVTIVEDVTMVAMAAVMLTMLAL